MGLDYKDYKLFTNFFRAIFDFNRAVQGNPGTTHAHLIVPDLAVQNHYAGYDLICCQLDAVFAAVKKCGSTWSPWARLQRL